MYRTHGQLYQLASRDCNLYRGIFLLPDCSQFIPHLRTLTHDHQRQTVLALIVQAMWCGHIYILMTEKYYETAGTWVLQLHLRPIYPTTSFQVAIHIGSISTGAKGHHQWTFPPDISGCYLETLRLVNTYDHICQLRKQKGGHCRGWIST